MTSSSRQPADGRLRQPSRNPFHLFSGLPLGIRLMVPFVLTIVFLALAANWWAQRSSETIKEVGSQWSDEINAACIGNLSATLSVSDQINAINADVLSSIKVERSTLETNDPQSPLRQVLVRFREQIRLFEFVSFVGVGFDDGTYIAVDRLGIGGAQRVVLRSPTLWGGALRVFDFDAYLQEGGSIKLLEHDKSYDTLSRPWFTAVADRPDGTRDWRLYDLATGSNTRSISRSRRVEAAKAVVVTTLTLDSFHEQLSRRNRPDSAIYLFERTSEGNVANHEPFLSVGPKATVGAWEKAIAEILRRTGSLAATEFVRSEDADAAILTTLRELKEADLHGSTPPPWIVATAVSRDKLLTRLTEQRSWVIGFCVGLATLLFGVAVLVHQRVSRPLRDIANFAATYSADRANQDEPIYVPPQVNNAALNRKDEVGVLATAVVHAAKTLDYMTYMARKANESESFEHISADATERTAAFLGFTNAYRDILLVTSSGSLPDADGLEHLPRDFARDAINAARESRTFQISRPREKWILLPLIHNREVMGIIELLAAAPFEIDCRLLPALEQGLQQLARAVQRDRNSKRREQYKSELGHDFRRLIGRVEIGVNEIAEAAQDDRRFPQLRTLVQKVRVLKKRFDQLYDYARIESGALFPESSKFDLREELTDTLIAVSGDAYLKNLELIAAVDPDVPQEAIFHPYCLHLIVGNLLENAVKFTESGEVELRVERLRGVDQTCTLRIRVRDTGPGVKPDVRDQMFEAFAKEGSLDGGLGLGLYFVADTVRKLGGRITVAEGVPHATFTVDLPMKFPPTTGEPRVNSLCAAKRVLLLYRNDAARGAIEELLRFRQMEVEASAEPPGDRPTAEFDLAVIDEALVTNEIISTFCGVDRRRAGRIIVIGSSPPTDRALRYCPKPIAETELFDEIDDALRGKVVGESFQMRQVLVVDDDAPSREESIEYFQGLGHKVRSAASYAEAEAIVIQDDFDLLVTDMKMERSANDGLALARLVWRRSKTTPVLFLTGFPPSVEEQLSPNEPGKVLRKPLREALRQLNRYLKRWGIGPCSLPNSEDQTGRRAVVRKYIRRAYDKLYPAQVAALRSAPRSGPECYDWLHDWRPLLGWLKADQAKALIEGFLAKNHRGESLNDADLSELEREMIAARPSIEEYLNDESSDRRQ